MRLLLCAAAPLCLFAAQAHAQDKLTASGQCTGSPDIEKALSENAGVTQFRGATCDVMVSEPGKRVTFTHAGAPQDRMIFTGTVDNEGVLLVDTLILGTAAPVPVKVGICNGGPLGDGQTAMICSAAYDQGGVTMGVSVVFVGKPN